MFPVLPRTAAALAAATLVPGLVVGLSTSAQAGIIGCDGKAPTYIGTQDGEAIQGTDGADVILALGGDDSIVGLGGDDTICGGDGNDTIYSTAGDDRVFGDAGDDTVYAGDGDDIAKGGPDGDSLFGEEGDDVLGGGRGSDSFIGGDDGDLMTGGPGLDAVAYVASDDGVVVSLRPAGGADDGNAADGPAGSRDEVRKMEAVFGSRFRDTITGNSRANFFLPQGGRDLLVGRGGNDFFDIADAQADRATCGDGRDEVRFDRGIDALRGCESKNPVDREAGRRVDGTDWLSQWARTAAN